MRQTTSTHTYHYVTLVVDGVPHKINQTYTAKDLNWGDNIGVQYQLDVNASGQGYSRVVRPSEVHDLVETLSIATLLKAARGRPSSLRARHPD